MRVHIYKVQTGQRKIYIDGQGVIGYFESRAVSFDDSNDAIREAENVVSRKQKGEYLGESELADEEIPHIIALGKTLKRARQDFGRNMKPIIESLEKKLNSPFC